MSVFLRKGTNRWAPSATSAVKHAYVSKRFQEGSASHMPWPFDKYKMPAAAKKWLSKYPVAAEDYQEEFVYLDEIESRINDHYTKQRHSARFRQAQNQQGVLGDYDDVDRTYPMGLAATETDQEHGRGNLINPAHYVGPQYLNIPRVYVDNERILPRHMLRNRGEVGRFQYLPAEPDSLFRFWNFWHMFGAVFVITVGKEWLILSSADTHHFFLYYITTGWIASMFVDWFLWWKALRGQEYYDHRFFPLQENVDNLFTLLDRLEKKPDLGIVTKKYHTYIDTLRERLVTRRVVDSIAEKTSHIISQLEEKAQKETHAAGRPQKDWLTTALTDTLAHFDKPNVKATYNKTAMAAFMKAGGAKLGESKNASSVVATHYKQTFANTEKTWYENQRKNGTLPWTHATETEKKNAKMAPNDLKVLYDAEVGNLSSKFHKFA